MIGIFHARNPRRKEAHSQIYFLLLFCVCFIANSALAQPIPPLRPARNEISPTFWEQHGWSVIIAAFVAVLIIAALLVLLTRPKRSQPEPPEVLARRRLTALQGRSEDGVLIMEASQILRHYVIFAFSLPPGELTTAELSQCLQSNLKTGPALAKAISDFLQQCDREKFAPHSMPPRMNTATRALELLDGVEAYRRQSLAKEPVA